MKTTIYELLGMIKDNKAPKEIIYDNIIWEYDGDYYFNGNKILEEYCNLTTSLNDEVEIIEEEKKIPKKLPYYDYSKIISSNDKLKTIELMLEKHEKRLNDNWEKINEIIDYLKSKGE